MSFALCLTTKCMSWAAFNYSPICRALPSLLEKFLHVAAFATTACHSAILALSGYNS